MKAAYGKTVRAVWAADGGQRFTRASSDPTIFGAMLGPELLDPNAAVFRKAFSLDALARKIHSMFNGNN